MIKTRVRVDDPAKHACDALIVPWPEKKPADWLKQIDSELNGAISAEFASKRFEGKKNQTASFYPGDALKAERLILVGAGKPKDITEETLRQCAGSAAKVAERSRCSTLAFYLPENQLSKSGSTKGKSKEAQYGALAEGALLGLYHFDEYKNLDEENAPSRVESVTVLAPASNRKAGIESAVNQAETLAEAVWTTRNLMSLPSNKATPSFLADQARKIARRFKFHCKVLGSKEMEKEKMGSLLGVARGSHEPPAFIILEYKGGKKKQAPVVIVGKGVTFDTGGISLKPSAGMDEMKFDMSGGAVAIGTLMAAAALKLKVNVVGIIPATENMPGGSAIKPGDILTASNGKTIEVLNTDAEGRLILADALVYAQRYQPKAVIDLATLTGACIVALGHVASAVVGTDQRLVQKLRDSGDQVGERLWELPLYEEFEKAVKSDIADLKNIASAGVGGGTIVGAAFLKPFVGDAPWAHLDIAGTAWTSEEKPYVPKGGSGFGVRLLVDYLKSI